MPGWHPVLPRLSAVAVSGYSKQTSTLLLPQAAVCCNSSSHIKLIFIPLLWCWGYKRGWIYVFIFLNYEIIWNIAVTLSCRRVENTSTLQTAANWRSQSEWFETLVWMNCAFFLWPFLTFPWRRSVLQKMEIHMKWSVCTQRFMNVFVYMWCVRSPA